MAEETNWSQSLANNLNMQMYEWNTFDKFEKLVYSISK